MEKTEKTKQNKNQKISLNDKAYKTLEKYWDMVNKTSNRKIKSSEIMDFLIAKLSETDIPRIQEHCYTATHRLDV